MAKARAIIKRRKAVTNIRRITRTMQLIATARYQQMFNRAVATRPYTEKIAQLVAHLSHFGRELDHPLLRVNEGAGRSAIILLTSNRGLCGGYNANILRIAIGHLAEQSDRQTEADIHAIGKKGVAYFKFLKRPLASAITTMPDWPPFDRVEPLANQMIAAYSAGTLDAVYVAYTRLISVGRQIPTLLRLLPIEDQASSDVPSSHARPLTPGQQAVEYEFSPPADQLLADLLPSYVKVRLYRCFTDAAVSEQIARMVAMKAATDAAGDMIRTLGQRYNRARQSQITMELLDIMGGANALK